MQLDSRWDRVRVLFTPGSARAVLMLVSVVAMVLGGSAGSRWD
jgi:hypothetical protein